MKQFGETAAAEYRALGIATALSPQIDLGTEPRWSRFDGTMGEDPNLTVDIARTYVDGFQTSTGAAAIPGGWGYKSVNAMVKHWPRNWFGVETPESWKDAVNPEVARKYRIVSCLKRSLGWLISKTFLTRQRDMNHEEFQTITIKYLHRTDDFSQLPGSNDMLVYSNSI